MDSKPMIAVSLVALMVAVLVLERGQRRRREAKPATKPTPAPAWVFVVLLAVWVGIGYFTAGARHVKRPPPGRPAPRRSNPAPIFLLVFVGAPALYVGYFWLKARRSFYDRGVARALAEAGGDWAAAEREIRRQIEDSGPSPKRTYALGTALAARAQWIEAHKCFVDVGQGTGPLARKAKESQAVILNTLGRSEEAVAILAELCREQPNDFELACNYCVCLANAGRSDEAREALERVQLLRRQNYVVGRSGREYFDARLEACRQHVVGVKPAPIEGLDEL